MDKYLFVVRSPKCKELFSTELYVPQGLISMAQDIMDFVRGRMPDEDVECCEIWYRTEHHTMALIATAF